MAAGASGAIELSEAIERSEVEMLIDSAAIAGIGQVTAIAARHTVTGATTLAPITGARAAAL